MTSFQDPYEEEALEAALMYQKISAEKKIEIINLDKTPIRIA